MIRVGGSRMNTLAGLCPAVIAAVRRFGAGPRERALPRPAEQHLHLFECVALRFGQQPPEQDESNESHSTVEKESAFASQDLGHGEERHADEEIEEPVGGSGDTVARRAGPQRVDFGVDRPRHRAHAGSEEQQVSNETEHRDPAELRRAPAVSVHVARRADARNG